MFNEFVIYFWVLAELLAYFWWVGVSIVVMLLLFLMWRQWKRYLQE